jgi:serine/threonine protein kinase
MITKTPQLECPPYLQLQAFLAGRMAAEDTLPICAHIENCQACLALLDRIQQQEPSDTVVDWVESYLSERVIDPGFHEAQVRIIKQYEANHGQELEPVLPKNLDQYELLEPLGEGASGRVFKARHVHLQRLVAIKILNTSHSQQTATIQRFYQEMEIVGRLDHRHVLRAIDARPADGYHMLVMEYVPGKSLAQVLQSVGRINWPESAELIKQATHGLEYAHQQQLIHRDLKPSNLLLTHHGVLKILDFGLAKLSSQQLDPQQPLLVGTSNYMAPEIWLLQTPDVRADLYALGCTFFKLLTGRVPYPTNELGLAAKKQAHCTSPLPSPREFTPDIPEGIVAIIQQLLAKDPAQRFQTPRALIDALEPFTHTANIAELVKQWDWSNDDTLPISNQLEATLTQVEPATKVDTRPAKRLTASWIFAGICSLCLLGWYLFNNQVITGNGEQQEQFALDRQYPVEALDVNYQLNYSSINNQPNLELATRRTALIKFTELKQEPFTMSINIKSPFEGAGGLYCGLRNLQNKQIELAQEKRYYQAFELQKTSVKNSPVSQYEIIHSVYGFDALRFAGNEKHILGSWTVKWDASKEQQELSVKYDGQKWQLYWNQELLDPINGIDPLVIPYDMNNIVGFCGITCQFGKLQCSSFSVLPFK